MYILLTEGSVYIMEHYYNNYRKQQKERERIMQSGCLIFAVFMAMMLTAWLVWQRVAVATPEIGAGLVA